MVINRKVFKPNSINNNTMSKITTISLEESIAVAKRVENWIGIHPSQIDFKSRQIFGSVDEYLVRLEREYESKLGEVQPSWRYSLTVYRQGIGLGGIRGVKEQEDQGIKDLYEEVKSKLVEPPFTSQHDDRRKEYVKELRLSLSQR